MDTERSDHLASNQAGLEKEKGNQIYLETNESKNTVIKKLWDTAKAALKGKFIAMQIYLRKQEKLQINNVTLHLKELQKEEQNPKGNPLSVVSFAIIFSHFEVCLFTLLIVSFPVQKLLSLIRSHLFSFVFISIALGGGSWRILL